MRQETDRNANHYCQGQSTTDPLRITKADATDHRSSSIHWGLRLRKSGILVRATEITRAMIKTDTTINTLEAENRRRLHYKGASAACWIHTLPRIVRKVRWMIRVTGRYSQKYPARKCSASRFGAVYIECDWGRRHKCSSAGGDVCVIRGVWRGKSLCAYHNNSLRGARNSKYLLHQ